MDAFRKIVLRMLTPSNDCFSWQIDEQALTYARLVNLLTISREAFSNIAVKVN